MATTSAATALTAFAQPMMKGDPLSDIELAIMNAANRHFHNYAPWYWTLGTLTDATLANGTNEYTVMSTPADFLRVQRVARVKVDPDDITDLEIVSAVPDSSTVTGTVKKVHWYTESTDLKYRVWPVPAGLPSGSEDVLVGVYKKKTTAITSDNKGDADVLLFPDEYYHIYEALCLYYAMVFSFDRRAGEVQFRGGETTMTGQLAYAHSLLTELAAKEAVFTDDVGSQQE